MYLDWCIIIINNIFYLLFIWSLYFYIQFIYILSSIYHISYLIYPNELKLNLTAASFNLRKQCHLSVEEVADMFDIGRWTLYSWRRMYLLDHTCFGEKKYRLKNANTYYRKINDAIISYICNTVIESRTVWEH